MKAHNQETQTQMTPSSSIQELKKGNIRFLEQREHTRNLLQQVEETSTGQYPFATSLAFTPLKKSLAQFTSHCRGQQNRLVLWKRQLLLQIVELERGELFGRS